MTTPFWIEKAWRDSVDSATVDDIKVAIQETLSMDDEHGAFWVGHMESENVLEVHKDLEVLYSYNDQPEDQLKTKLISWGEIENLYKLFFDSNFELIKEILTDRTNGGKR
jgi:hypothetical protein